MRSGRFLVLLGILLILLSLPLLIGGVQLARLGGSLYYIVAGITGVVSGILISRRRISGAWLYGITVLATLIWAIAEVRFDFFQLLPRLAGPLLFAIPVALSLPLFGDLEDGKRRRSASYGLTLLLVAIFIGVGVYAFIPHAIVSANSAVPATMLQAAGSGLQSSEANEWRQYGRSAAGTRFAPFTQISPDNVSKLQVAWTFRMGDQDRKIGDHEDTPLQVGNVLYVCTGRNVVFAIEADTGKQIWRFDPHTTNDLWPRCRGVAYYKDRVPATSVGAACADRILATTVDAQLIALDAQTGKPCEDFGQHGIVDLKLNMGRMSLGDYYPTSAPTVMRDRVVVGGLVYDNVKLGMPSGVIRAYNTKTGALTWAWDLGNPAITREPPPGQIYTLATPNMWSAPSFDDRLGLAYIPLGAATPDFWGTGRSKEVEDYENSLVALDIETGRPKWHFQTVHHDLWDTDLPPQPALYDIPDGHGGITPVVVQGGKGGQLYVLDRRDGKPVTEVQEKPVAQDSVPDDKTSPTQPFSVGMPAIGTDRLTEARMWGATMYDQLWCRIQFRKLHYEGQFTPPTTTPTLTYPGSYGGMNWGGVSIDESRGYLIVNDMRIPFVTTLVPRAEADRRMAAAKLRGGEGQSSEDYKTVDRSGMYGTPYGDAIDRFMSPLGIPCQSPPYGTLSAIDLRTKQLVWQVPMGTPADTAARDVKVGLPVPIGMPTVGGPISTQSGLVFYAGTQDFYLRAMDVNTGKELWKGRLPVGSMATPMTFISPKDKQQYVVIVAGGADHSKEIGDYVIAYKLPVPADRNGS